jgi:hypothetical protein
MKAAEIYRENAEVCAQLAAAEPSTTTLTYKRYRRMEAAWGSLAEQRDWLDGEVSSVNNSEPNDKPPF